MTSFVAAGDPGVVTDTTKTTFVSGGGAPAGTDAADTTVVLELGGRKFTKADLINKITHADAHIATLTAEQTALKEAAAAADELLKKQITAADLLAKLKGTTTPVTTTTETPVQPTGLTLADVEALIAKREESQTASQQDAKRKENWKLATETLTKAFGKDKVDSMVEAVVAGEGMTMAQAKSFAESHPATFLKLFPELNKAAPKTPLNGVKASAVNPIPPAGAARQSSGFMTASLKDSVSILAARYKEAGL